jgi:peptide/nickel transport system permease protein
VLPRSALLLPCLILTALLACALVPDWIAPYRATDMDADAILSAPAPYHWLGTDHFGRDILSLLIYGAAQSILIGVGTVLFGAVLGGCIGIVAGYSGGLVDLAFMRLIDLWLSVPHILLAILIVTALRPGFTHCMIAVGLVMAPRFARVMRARVMEVTAQPFVAASRSIGTPPLFILARHIVPHTLAPLLVMMTLGVADGILIGASLSFIVLGVIEDRPDWGFLLSQGRNYVTVAWWFPTFPGLAITLLVVSVNMLGETLRKRLDPRS